MATLPPTIEEIIATVEAKIDEVKGKIAQVYFPCPGPYWDHLQGELRHLYLRRKRLYSLLPGWGKFDTSSD